MAETLQAAAEFQALPLELIIATPLTAAVKAQYAAAQATQAFIKGFIDEKTNKPYTVELSVETTSGPAAVAGGTGAGGAASTTVIKAPMHTINRSGTLEITLRASESEMPDGLRRFLAVLSRGIEPEKK